MATYGPSRTSRSLDADDLSARLADLITEREAADTREQACGLQSTNPRGAGDPSGSKSAENRHSTHLEPAAAERDGLSNSVSRRRQSFHGPTGLEYSMLQRAQGRGFELDDRDRSCPLLPETTPSLASTISYIQHAGTGACAPSRRTSYIPSSRRPSDSHYVPQVAASQFASTAAPNSIMDVHGARQTSRRLSANALRYSEPTSPRGRRRSTKASRGLWDGVHEPTIWEAIATDAKPGDRRSMFERTGDKYARGEARPRRMTAGDVSKAQGMSDDALESSGGRGSADTEQYELVNGHRVDWTQADEEAKMPRSKRLLRKADSILRMRRGSSGKSREGDESSGGSVVDGQEENYVVNGGPPESPSSSKSSRSFRAKSIWPWKKQAALESH